jgi:hypothetical protein
MRTFRLTLLAALIWACACSRQPPPLPRPNEPRPVEIFVAPPDITDESFPSPLPPAAAERILRETMMFDTARPGPKPGRQIQAFNVVLAQPDSRERFHRLGRESRPPGRLYGLCGLLLVAPAEGNRLAQFLSSVSGDVTIRDADFIFETAIVRAIVMVYANDVATRLREQREAAYAFFDRPR